MKYTNAEINLSLTLDNNLYSFLIKKAQEHYPKEFGGLLIGYYTKDLTSLNITGTLLPKKFKSQRFMFERSIEGLEDELKKVFKETPSKYYVGEWHTHPNGSCYLSSTDLAAISSIVNYSGVVINNPVFLIIAVNKIENELGFYVPFKNKIYKYEKQN